MIVKLDNSGMDAALLGQNKKGYASHKAITKYAMPLLHGVLYCQHTPLMSKHQ